MKLKITYFIFILFLVISNFTLKAADENKLPASIPSLGVSTNAPVIAKTATAIETLKICREMLPYGIVTMNGGIRLRNRKGFNLAQYKFSLKMERLVKASKLTIEIFDKKDNALLQLVEITRDKNNNTILTSKDKNGKISHPQMNSLVMGTDVTWLDLTLDFLWWPNAEYDGDREDESVHGQACKLILIAPDKPIKGLTAARVWIDRKTGCLLQAEQLDENVKPVRRLWGTRIKKFNGERWMASVLEVETLGSGHRTKITIDNLNVR